MVTAFAKIIARTFDMSQDVKSRKIRRMDWSCTQNRAGDEPTPKTISWTSSIATYRENFHPIKTLRTFVNNNGITHKTPLIFTSLPADLTAQIVRHRLHWPPMNPSDH